MSMGMELTNQNSLRQGIITVGVRVGVLKPKTISAVVAVERTFSKYSAIILKCALMRLN